MPLDQQANAIDLSIFPYFIHIFLYPWIFTITAPFWNSSTTFFFLLLVSPGVTTDSHAGQNTTLIYLFFAVFSSQRRKTFLFLSNSLAAIMSAEKRVPKLNHTLSWRWEIWVRDKYSLTTWRLCQWRYITVQQKKNWHPRPFFIDTRISISGLESSYRRVLGPLAQSAERGADKVVSSTLSRTNPSFSSAIFSSFSV